MHPFRWRSSSIFLMALCILFLTSGCVRKSNRTTKVTVAGEATNRVEPDTAVVTLSVVTQNSQALTAQQENARKSEAVANSVKAIAGSTVEIKTSDYVLQPQYDSRDNSLPKIVGYDARNTVIVTMSDLKNVGAVIDAASRAGANSIEGISFVLRQTSPDRGQALAHATQQAMNKARSIAEALGGHVLRVVEENESSTVGGVAETYDSLSADSNLKMRGRTPISTGLLSIRSNVQLIVEVES